MKGSEAVGLLLVMSGVVIVGVGAILFEENIVVTGIGIFLVILGAVLNSASLIMYEWIMKTYDVHPMKLMSIG
eukprot:CAMPEP_0202973326 /NCGR_PEP_ID=MMETSP1396-20130829/48940_1 /ASSEMBLY_ACC=CAM_ASM_000872 /TAXON_ID= /ORGANISM="Pseudokeronopsis sp., Strain Brazil" /LENGTH=72 /DNA_ID=CAMNT_0049705187 /DNA_START=287 /DNA_END=501 /DNA_ORIENTATION=-